MVKVQWFMQRGNSLPVNRRLTRSRELRQRPDWPVGYDAWSRVIRHIVLIAFERLKRAGWLVVVNSDKSSLKTVQTYKIPRVGL